MVPGLLYTGPTATDLLQIPDTLKTRRQWVLWQGVPRANHPDKLDKIPVNPHTLTKASSTDPLTWGTFDECITAVEVALEEWEQQDPAAYRGGGIGYVFTSDDPYAGVDLDNCIDETTGLITPWAQQYIDTLASYTELTPSQKGLHILVEGDLPPGGRKHGGIEMYTQGRFFTVTGWRLPEALSTIEARTIPLQNLWCLLFGAAIGETVWCLDAHGAITNATLLTIATIEPSQTGELYALFAEVTTGWPLARCERGHATIQQSSTPALPDYAILAKAFQAQNAQKFTALWAGEWQGLGYPSQSDADLALCGILRFWTQDPIQIDRLVRQSGLMRPKWDEPRGTQLYGARTIAAALSEPSEHYTPPATLIVSKAPVNGTTPHTPAPTVATDPAFGFQFNFDAAVSARELLKMMFVPQRFLVDKLIPDGLTILAAPAKSYKSYFSLSLALATIGEGDWCNTFPVKTTGNVVFFGLEAPLRQLRNRLHQLRANYRAEHSPHELIFFSGMKSLPSFKSGLQSAIEQIIERYSPRLIVIDPLSYLYRLGRQDDLASATLDLLWPLAEMASEAQVAIFAPEHMRKRSKEDVSIVDQLNGSYIKAAVVHGLLLLRREGEDIVIETVMRDTRCQEVTMSLTFDDEQHEVVWGYKGSSMVVHDARNSILKNHVLDDVQQRGYPVKVQDIHEALVAKNCAKNTTSTKDQIRQILHRAEKDGLVAVSRRGEYYWLGSK